MMINTDVIFENIVYGVVYDKLMITLKKIEFVLINSNFHTYTAGICSYSCVNQQNLIYSKYYK